MYEFFAFDVTTDERPSRRLAILFCPYLAITEEDVSDALRRHFDRAVPPDLIVLLGTSAQEDTFRALRESTLLRDGLPHFTRYVSPPRLIGVCLFGQDFRLVDSRDTDVLNPASFIQHIRQRGLMTIFSARKGVLESWGAFHYVKPSGRHSDKFIRTANVLIRGAEVAFIAFWLLPYLRDGIRYIYTDTAAINIVGQTLLALASQCKPGVTEAAINSFSSYDGLKTFYFEGTDECLVLISASTSGELEAKLNRDHHIARQHIWTLFFLGPEHQATINILCDLKRNERHNADGYSEITSYPADQCALCRDGLIPIGIAGDQFLPEGAKISDFQITVRDRPMWLNDFCEEFVGHQVIRANCGSQAENGRIREIFFALGEIYGHGDLNSPHKFLKRLDSIIRQSLSFTINRVVHLEDESSLILAERVCRILALSGLAANVSMVSATDLQRDLEEHTSDRGTTLVVAGVVVTGRQLLAVSQALRHVQQNRSIQYLIGIARPVSAEAFKALRRDLQYGERGSEHYDVRCGKELWLPDDSSNRIQPWTEERDTLLRVRELPEIEPGVLDLIDARLSLLDSSCSSKGGGLVDDLFWPSSATSTGMSLRPNFAFWRFEYGKSVSQADVYFTITSILHHRRSGGVTRAAMTDHDHHRIVLSPRCFDQFNDGVIQSSLLRSSLRSELNYGVDAERSRMMSETFTFFMRNAKNPAGEASTEFLLALCGRKLRLAPSDYSRIQAALRDLRELEGINRAIADTIFRQA